MPQNSMVRKWIWIMMIQMRFVTSVNFGIVLNLQDPSMIYGSHAKDVKVISIGVVLENFKEKCAKIHYSLIND